MRVAATLFIAGLALAPFSAEAQSYRCVGSDGKKYYGSVVPTQCLGLPVEQLNSQGMVVKRFDAAASAAEREKKAADEDERRKREAVTKEEGRRNRALLATYTSEKDIEDARARALKDNEAAVTASEQRIAGMKKKLADLRKEFNAQDKAKPSPRLADDIRNLEFDIRTQEDLLAAKKRDVTTINARYNDDKKRYGELTGLDTRERASKMVEAKSLTIVNPVDTKAVAARDRRDADRRARSDESELRRLEAEQSRKPGVTSIGPTERSGGSTSTTVRTSSINCGGARIVCDSRETVMCGGRAVTCP